MRQMERMVAASGLDWTIVRAARLVDGPLTQRDRIGDDGSLTKVTKISRSDLADFMAREVQDAKRIGRAIVISY